MKQLTVFSAPKPFTDPHINVIQRNAIRSWQQLGDVEILLIGEEAGLAQAAAELGVRHLPGAKRNAHGTPLVSSIFGMARQASDSELLLFTNTDMIYFPDALRTVLQLKQNAPEFALMGQRYDLDVREPLDFSFGWEQRLRADIAARGRLHPLGGSDYFLFPRHLFSQVPDFAIGRAGWDNWMIYHAVQQPWLAVDATRTITAVHQNHGYAHLAGEQGHQRHPETDENLRLAGGMRKMYTLLDLEYELVNTSIAAKPWSLTRFLRGLERWLQPDELVGRGPRWWLLRFVRRWRRSLTGVR
jgi:hypothetical protein